MKIKFEISQNCLGHLIDSLNNVDYKSAFYSSSNIYAKSLLSLLKRAHLFLFRKQIRGSDSVKISIDYSMALALYQFIRNNNSGIYDWEHLDFTLAEALNKAEWK